MSRDPGYVALPVGSPESMETEREGERERENGRGMFLQRVSRMSHELCVTRDLWKLENQSTILIDRY